MYLQLLLQLTRAAAFALGVVVLAAPCASGQVFDADCFAGTCGGIKGIPECPADFEEVGLVLYANSKADAARSCETVVSCTNLNREPVEISCRFYHGFNSIRPGGPTDALCAAYTPNVGPGDTTECATDSSGDPLYQAAGIFLAGDGDCPVFEGKGLVCIKGGKSDRVLCEAHLVCGNGSVLENINVVSTKPGNSGAKKTKD